MEEHKEAHHEQAHHEPQKRSDIRNYVIVALATALIVIGAVWIRDSFANAGTQKAALPAPAGLGNAPSAATGVSTEGSYFKGKENAPVTIIEFSDFQCPFCGRFFQQTLPDIERTYVATGKVKFVYKDFPLDSIHPHATPAALAARCAGEQGKFWEFHDLIFNNQQSLGESSYNQWASQLGLDAAKFSECSSSRKYLSAVRQDLVEGQRAGVQGTPAFLINGQLLSGAQPFAAFQQAVESALAQG